MATRESARRSARIAVVGRPRCPVDRLLLGYLAIVTVVAVARAPSEPECWWLLPAHALFVLLLYPDPPPAARTGRAGARARSIRCSCSWGSTARSASSTAGAPIHDAAVQRLGGRRSSASR